MPDVLDETHATFSTRCKSCERVVRRTLVPTGNQARVGVPVRCRECGQINRCSLTEPDAETGERVATDGGRAVGALFDVRQYSLRAPEFRGGESS